MSSQNSAAGVVRRPLDAKVMRLEEQKSKQRWLRLSFSERRITLGVIDLALLNGMLLLAQYCRHDVFSGQWMVSYHFTLTLIWLGVCSTLDAYNLRRAANSLSSAVHSAGCAMIASFVYALIPFYSPDLPRRRTDLLFFPVMSILSVGLWRICYAMFLAHNDFTKRLLVIGAGRAGTTLVEALGSGFPRPVAGGEGQGKGAPKSPLITHNQTTLNAQRSTLNAGAGEGAHREPDDHGFEILGFIDDDPRKQSQWVRNIPVLGNRSQLAVSVDRLEPDAIVLAISHAHTIHPELFESILACRERGFQIVSMQKIYEEFTGRVPVEHAGYDLDVVVPNSVPLFFDLYMGIRRGADILAGLVGCAVCTLLIPFVWLANRLFAPGDLFYRQERLGQASQPFRVAKFRSMRVDAEQSTGAVWASKDDKRITAVGKILRRTRLDEFPQFWNVLKGEMSLIGPRPERPKFVKKLSETIPFYRIRHAVKPGITGWAQVRFRYGASEEDSLIKLQYDLYYIKHQGPLLDLQIVLRTIMVMLGLKGQ